VSSAQGLPDRDRRRRPPPGPRLLASHPCGLCVSWGGDLLVLVLAGWVWPATCDDSHAPLAIGHRGVELGHTQIADYRSRQRRQTAALT
jgi:hypothetical protein